MEAPSSARLAFTRLTAADLGRFHALCVDPHVRRYLLDGDVVDAPWAEAALETSEAIFASHGVGLWLLSLREGRPEDAIGFAGFFRFPGHGSEPELIYALAGAYAGQGYATEAARACVAHVEARGWEKVVAAADAPNTASIAVLRKLGFVRTHTVPGAFGRIAYFARHAPRTVEGVRSLLADAGAAASADERVDALVTRSGVRIERIVSSGQHTPEGTWYEQDEHEWVLLLEGAARLSFEEGPEVALARGDSVFLAAGRRHRVAWTAPDSPTIWLAVFFRP